MANSRQTSAPKKAAFLAAFARVASITKAAELVKIDRDNHYLWKATDPEYAAAFERTRLTAAETLEDEAVRRAKEGVQKPVYQGGKRVGYVQEYSDTLLIFLLKGNLPDKYKERAITEHTGPKGEPLFDFSRHTVEHLAELARALRAARSRSGITAPE